MELYSIVADIFSKESETRQSIQIHSDQAGARMQCHVTSSSIPTIVIQRPAARTNKSIRHSVLRPIRRSARIAPPMIYPFSAPSLYVLNAAAQSKSQDIDHLTADLISYNVDAAVSRNIPTASSKSTTTSCFEEIKCDDEQVVLLCTCCRSSSRPAGPIQLTTTHMNFSGFASGITHSSGLYIILSSPSSTNSTC